MRINEILFSQKPLHRFEKKKLDDAQVRICGSLRPKTELKSVQTFTLCCVDEIRKL